MLSKFDSVINAAKQMAALSSEKVGAALLCRDFSIYSAAEFKFKSGVCVSCEISALAKALENRKTKFTALAIYGRDGIDENIKQTLLQLGDMWVVFASDSSPATSTTLSKL